MFKPGDRVLITDRVPETMPYTRPAVGKTGTVQATSGGGFPYAAALDDLTRALGAVFVKDDDTGRVWVIPAAFLDRLNDPQPPTDDDFDRIARGEWPDHGV